MSPPRLDDFLNGYLWYLSFIRLCAVLGYYIRRGILTPVALISNRSFLVYHPDHLLPTLIGTAQDSTIHSFHPSSDLLHHFHVPRSPILRRWCKPEEILKRIVGEPPEESGVLLQGNLRGPPLRQGMVLVQQEGRIVIGEEIGRWPTREDILLTICFNLDTGNTFCLFIPVDFFDRSQIHDDYPRSPLRTPFSLTEAIRESRRILHNPSAILSSV